MLNDFTTQWALGPFDLSQQSGISINWQQETAGAKFLHRVELGTTAGAPGYETGIALRVLCHYLINNIPDEGLAELCQSIADIHDYYITRAHHLRSLPLPSRDVLKAKSGATYERPAFGLAEE